MVFVHNERIHINLHPLMAYHVEFRDVGNDPELEAFDFLKIPFDAGTQSLELISQLLSTANPFMRSYFSELVQNLLKLMQ